MNIKLLRRVQKAILKHADQFRMESFFSEYDSRDNRAGGCGTSACIAGWAVHLARGSKRLDETRVVTHDKVAKLGSKHLQLNGVEAELLFYTENWPAQYEDAYYTASTNRGAALAAVRRIDHFIKIEGLE